MVANELGCRWLRCNAYQLDLEWLDVSAHKTLLCTCTKEAVRAAESLRGDDACC